ncbi:glycerophosphodiester phosphodiesterase family protein [Lactobacillus sp. Sy-1]|uniref:glycerophosphodiester phosphodiesterase family protein n=1 Tax=Lactobacillus sp. Sy-1 TaxID=2109645 RepID=UPI001C569E4E|nr:glycerophosphodiester phosphodiesterase family protein [Lactobacillus sp. Sy-1]MBW1605663.1 glycerophosphodiester phosphodiesterase [Lactobacillus sp. Sy-1]
MKTKIFAHRGDKRDAPENTLIAFQKALELGVDGIETDVHLTKDRQLVIIHDESVERTTGHVGLVNDLTLAELKQLNANLTHPELGIQSIPTLLELVECLNQGGFTGDLNLEIKTDHIHYQGIEEMVVKFFESHAHGFRLIYSSFNLATTERMIELAPQVETAGLMIYHYGAMRRLFNQRQIRTFHPEVRILMAHPLFSFHRYFRPWTVNQKFEIAFCLRRHYRGLITDHPQLALQMRDRIQGADS